MLINMLNLPNFKILDMKESEFDYRFLVESTALSPSHCPKCGTVANLHKHGKKQQLFFDLPMQQNVLVLMSNANVINVENVMKHFLKTSLIWISIALLPIGLKSGFRKQVLKKRLPVLRKRLALMSLKLKLILELLNGLVLMKYICLKTIVV